MVDLTFSRPMWQPVQTSIPGKRSVQIGIDCVYLRQLLKLLISWFRTAMPAFDNWTSAIIRNPVAAIGISVAGTTVLSIATAWYSYYSYRRSLMGNLPITTSLTQYNKQEFGKYLTWDKCVSFTLHLRLQCKNGPWRGTHSYISKIEWC